MAAEIHTGDYGTTIVIQVLDQDGLALPLNNATLLQLIIRRPDKTILAPSCILNTDGLDGKIKYVLVNGDINQSGNYQFQVHVTTPNGNWYSDVETKLVVDNLQ